MGVGPGLHHETLSQTTKQTNEHGQGQLQRQLCPALIGAED